MGRHLRLGEFLVAVEGVAMMRQLFDGDDRAAAARLRDIRGIVCDGGDTDPCTSSARSEGFEPPTF
jgi:hypothetical protein